MNHPPSTCAECRYVQEERAGIHEHEGRAPRWKAEELAKSEKCGVHREFSNVEMMHNWERRRHANGKITRGT